MNSKNILSESFFSKLKNNLALGLKALTKAGKNKDVIKDKKVKAAWSNLNKAIDNSDKALRAYYKDLGLKYPE
jgi:hypothetical protein